MPQHVGYQDSLNLTISLCLTYTLCIACVRIWIRKGAFGADDLVIAAATILTLCHSAASYAALASGLGTPWSSLAKTGDLRSLDDASIAGVVTFIVALYVSKCAMLSFLTRITKMPVQIKLYHICNAVVAIIGVITALIATVGCPAPSGYYWAFHANAPSCPSQSARWQAITALDVITELLLLALPVHLVWGLQMPRKKKAMIIIAFYLRLPVLGFAIARNYYTMQLSLPNTDPGMTGALVVIWLEVELAYALAASTLSALKAFTESFNSGFGLGFTRGKGEGSYGMSDVTGSSGQSSKLKDSSALERSADASRMGSIAPTPAYLAKGEQFEVRVSPLTPAVEVNEEHPALKLRPGTEPMNFTCVSADPTYGGHEPWRDHASARSESSTGAEDMVIVRETGYEVQHDTAPMLPPQYLPV
ncbi:hypothetical protein LTR08_000477 [Meristemomyces frigidus]|nr:hypothetical protein LTR08_000477 [Meristemomyces frigidus]